MQSDGRVLTVEEAKNLAPHTSEEQERHVKALETLLELRGRAVERLGRVMTEDEIDDLLAHDEELDRRARL